MSQLTVSDSDVVSLTFEVAKRLVELQHLALRVKGVDLLVPPTLIKAMFLFDQLAQRHQKADFRHSLAEWQALKEVAQWTVDVNCELRNQPAQRVEWSH